VESDRVLKKKAVNRSEFASLLSARRGGNSPTADDEDEEMVSQDEGIPVVTGDI
jgi:hypothetical protein